MAGQHIFGYQSKKWRWGLSWQTLTAELPRQESHQAEQGKGHEN